MAGKTRRKVKRLPWGGLVIRNNYESADRPMDYRFYEPENGHKTTLRYRGRTYGLVGTRPGSKRKVRADEEYAYRMILSRFPKAVTGKRENGVIVEITGGVCGWCGIEHEWCLCLDTFYPTYGYGRSWAASTRNDDATWEKWEEDRGRWRDWDDTKDEGWVDYRASAVGSTSTAAIVPYKRGSTVEEGEFTDAGDLPWEKKSTREEAYEHIIDGIFARKAQAEQQHDAATGGVQTLARYFD